MLEQGQIIKSTFLLVLSAGMQKRNILNMDD